MSWASIAGAAVLAAALGCSAVAQPDAPGEPAAADYAKPDRRLAVQGARRMHIRCLGTGSPTIILTAGLGDWGYAWRSVHDRLAASSRVCAWDRAGSGFSDPSPNRQDARGTTQDMERLLNRAGERPPYLLVGHSIGSFETMLFAFRHPDQVAGIVLVDPSSPFQYRRFEAVAPTAFDHIDDAMKEDFATLRECIAHFEPSRPKGRHGGGADCVKADDDYPPAVQAELNRINGNPGAVRNLLSLSTSMDRSSRQFEASRRPLGNMPLIVLTAGEPLPLPPELRGEIPLVAAEWRKMHHELASLSSRGSARLVENAGHYIQLEQPEVVIGAVKEVLGAPRRLTPSEPFGGER